MTSKFYSSERAVQIIISLLKQHNIRKVVVSPGATNVTLVASLQNDSWFDIYSSVDERSAAYMACGIAIESCEPVVLTCTGATASRNYLPGLTEAYYRKLPILAITATQNINRVGHLQPQHLDRSIIQNDIAVCSEHLFPCDSPDSEWECEIKVNRAILALKYNGGGPAHLNFTTTYSRDFSVENLPIARKIDRIVNESDFPELPVDKKIAVFVGAHAPVSPQLERAIDEFCSTYDSVVFCDQSSGYRGKYRAQLALVAMQTEYVSPVFDIDILIHIGEISGDYPLVGALKIREAVWRVSPDGELRDYFKKLRCVFDTEEIAFFKHYARTGLCNDKFLKLCKEEYNKIFQSLPDLPFSNLWTASQLCDKLPENCTLHLGILNSLRAWNVFNISNSIETNCNTGGFGIDGILSTLLGASLANSNKLHFCVLGDLAFFYDMNLLGNRHCGCNMRILLVNNGMGTEFKNYTHHGSMFGQDTDKYIAAAGHFGQQSRVLVKHFVEDLGFEYIAADSKESFMSQLPRFISADFNDKSIVFEIFTSSADESDALRCVNTAFKDPTVHVKNVVKNTVKSLLGTSVVDGIKKIQKK